MFDSEQMPFVGFIVGTYSNSIDHKSQFTSLLRCFILEVDEDKDKRNNDNDRDEEEKKIPFEIKTTIVPQESVDEHVIDYINYILREIEMDDAFDTNWKGNYTKREKTRTCINNLFKQNIKDLKEFSFNEVVCKTEVSDEFKKLEMPDNNFFFNALNTLKQRHVGHPKFNDPEINSVEESKSEIMDKSNLNYESKCKDSKYISCEKLQKVLLKIIKMLNTKSSKNRCQIEIIGDELEIKTIDLTNPKISKTEKLKEVKNEKQEKKEKEEEECQIEEVDSDDEEDNEEDNEEDCEDDKEEYKLEKSEEKQTKTKNRKRKAEEIDEDYNENESDEESRKCVKKAPKSKVKPKKKSIKNKSEKKPPINPASSIKFPPGPNQMLNQQIILSILQNRQLNPLLPRLPNIGNPFMNQNGIGNPPFLNPLMQPTNEIAKTLNTQNNNFINQQNTNSKSPSPPVAGVPNPLPSLPTDTNNPFLNMIQNQMNKLATLDPSKAVNQPPQPPQPNQPPHLPPLQHLNQVMGQNTSNPALQPPLNPMDPVIVAQNYLSSVMKKHTDVQQRVNEMNMLRKDMLQKSLSSMYAATNLYFLMSKSNWMFKPPTMCLFINQFCSCQPEASMNPAGTKNTQD